MSSSYKIVVIACYYGNFPSYFSLFERSCELNPDIDWLIFCDGNHESRLPNMRFVPMELAEIEKMARKNTGCDFLRIHKPYKICDYRPVYGEIFRDYLKEYDFWGYCDFDVIFGDIRNFITPDILDKYDKILPNGHLALFRNTPENNVRYKEFGNKFYYKTVFTMEKGCCFDEWPGINNIFRENGFPIYEKIVFADLSAYRKRFSLHSRSSSKYPRSPDDYTHQLFFWEDGKLMRAYWDNNEVKTDEFLYVHLRGRPFPPFPFDPKTVRAFYITRFGFIEKNAGELPTKQMMQKLNPFYGKLWEKIELKFKRRMVHKQEKSIFVGRKFYGKNDNIA